MKKKKVLVVHYTSPSGQLSEIVHHLIAPLAGSDNIEMHEVVLHPRKAFPFPWPMLTFFDTFPECVHLDPPPMEGFGLQPHDRFDLVILGYQVWFLSPSLPTTAFLQDPDVQSVLRDTPVVTLVACRDMWLMAQERVREFLSEAGARLVGHIALVDEAGTAGSFLATPLWMLTGRRGPMLGGLIPRAGVKPEQVVASRRFGERILQALVGDRPLDESLLRGLGAVKVDTRLIATERAARRGFLLWGRLLRALGAPGAVARRPVVVLYLVFLLLLILVVLPISMLLKMLAAPFMRKRIEAQRVYFSHPSGMEIE